MNKRILKPDRIIGLTAQEISEAARETLRQREFGSIPYAPFIDTGTLRSSIRFGLSNRSDSFRFMVPTLID